MIDLEKLSEIHSPGYVIEIYNKGVLVKQSQQSNHAPKILSTILLP